MAAAWREVGVAVSFASTGIKLWPRSTTKSTSWPSEVCQKMQIGNWIPAGQGWRMNRAKLPQRPTFGPFSR